MLNNSGDSLTAHTFSTEETPWMLSGFYFPFLSEGRAEPNSVIEYSSVSMVTQGFACAGFNTFCDSTCHTISFFSQGECVMNCVYVWEWRSREFKHLSCV